VSTIDGNGEVRKNANDIAREFMLGSVMAAAMKQLRSLDKPYMRLPEAEQKRVIAEVETDCEAAIRRAVEIIASDDRTRFVAAVEQVVFKDGVKAVLTMANTEASHELADTAGGSVLVVIEDPYRYLRGGAGKPQADAEQLSIQI
jgi:hypothetical protein